MLDGRLNEKGQRRAEMLGELDSHQRLAAASRDWAIHQRESTDRIQDVRTIPNTSRGVTFEVSREYNT